MQLTKGTEQEVALSPQPPIDLAPGPELFVQTRHVIRKVPVAVPRVLTDQLAIPIEFHVLRQTVDIRTHRAGHQFIAL